MLKSINKKKLSLFLFIATLMQFASISPMPIKKPTKVRKISKKTATNITDMPFDCWDYIFQFYEDHRDITLSCNMRLACKDFKQAVLSRPLSLHIDCEIKGKKINNIFKFGKVKRLTTCECDFKILKPILIKLLPNLKLLSFFECSNFTGEFEKKLSNLQKLFIINSPGFTGKCIKNMPKLQTLSVSCQNKFTGKHLPKTPSLRDFKVSGCPGFTGEPLKKTPNLNVFKALSCRNFNGKHLEHTLKVKKLKFSRCPGVLLKHLKPIKNLLKLKLIRCFSFFDELQYKETSSLPSSLQKLLINNLASNLRISDTPKPVDISNQLENLKNLQQLRLFNIKIPKVQKVIDKLPNLNTLHIDGRKIISIKENIVLS